MEREYFFSGKDCDSCRLPFWLGILWKGLLFMYRSFADCWCVCLELSIKVGLFCRSVLLSVQGSMTIYVGLFRWYVWPCMYGSTTPYVGIVYWCVWLFCVGLNNCLSRVLCLIDLSRILVAPTPTTAVVNRQDGIHTHMHTSICANTHAYILK